MANSQQRVDDRIGPNERLAASRLIIWVAIGAAVFFVVVTGFKFECAKTWERLQTAHPGIIYTVDALLGNIPILVVIQLIINLSEDRRVQHMITSTLLRIFMGQDREIFSPLSPGLKQQIVQHSIENLLDSNYGSVLYSQIVAPYLEEESPYRRSFVYDIACLDELALQRPVPAGSKPALFVEQARDQFTWIRQEVSYTRHGFKKDRIEPSLVAVFAFTQAQLNAFVMKEGSRELFFRELIHVPTDLKDFLFSLNDAEINLIFTSVFDFRAYGEGNTALPFAVRWKPGANPGDKYVEVRIRNPAGRLNGSGCRLGFVLPHEKADQSFLVTLRNPVEPRAQVVFTGSPAMESVSCIPFTSQFRSGGTEIKEMQDAKTIAITTRDWLFPISGAMFIWKYKDNAPGPH